MKKIILVVFVFLFGISSNAFCDYNAGGTASFTEIINDVTVFVGDVHLYKDPDRINEIPLFITDSEGSGWNPVDYDASANEYWLFVAMGPNRVNNGIQLAYSFDHFDSIDYPQMEYHSYTNGWDIFSTGITIPELDKDTRLEFYLHAAYNNGNPEDCFEIYIPGGLDKNFFVDIVVDDKDPVNPVPEPSTLILIMAGLALLLGIGYMSSHAGNNQLPG